MSNRSTPLNTPLRSAGHAIRAMQDLERQASANRRLAWERAGRPKPPPTPKKRYGHSGEVRACAARLRQENERLRELGPEALGASLRAVTALPAAIAHVAATPSAAPPPPATPPSASLAALPASRPPPPAEPAVVRRHSADFLDPKGPGTPPKARPGLTSKTSSWTPLPGGAPPTPEEPKEVPLFFGDLGAVLGAPAVDDRLGAMAAEHCSCADSHAPFRTESRVETTSARQWALAYAADDDAAAAANAAGGVSPRRALLPSERESRLASINRKLKALGHAPMREDEFVATRLYDGPMVAKYNAVLRALVPSFGGGPVQALEYERLCERNSYATTLHALNSGIAKMNLLLVAEQKRKAAAAASASGAGAQRSLAF